MHLLSRIVLLLAGLSIVPLPNLRPPASIHVVSLSTVDRQQASQASQLAARNPRGALRWLTGRPDIRSAMLGLDGKTVDVHFRDGAEIVILPRESGVRHLPSLRPQSKVEAPSAAAPAAGRAIVLEPFADRLGMGSNAGQGEIDLLTQAGFQVDVLRDTAVTVAAMENLANYGMVYMESHSGLLKNGDAILVVNETSIARYPSLYADGSVKQALIAGDPSNTPFNAITSKFISNHLGVFPSNAIVYLNGCSTLSAPVFWDALQHQNVATMVSWDREVWSDIDDMSAQLVLSYLLSGDTVADSVSAAQRQNLGQSDVGGVVASLGFLGDGSNTLSKVSGIPLVKVTLTPTPMSTMTATPTATPTVTATPTPLPTLKPRSKTVKCKKGYKLVHGKCHRVVVKCKKGYHLVHGKCRKKPRCTGKQCKRASF